MPQIMWTFQRKKIVQKLQNTGCYYPVFTSDCRDGYSYLQTLYWRMSRMKIDGVIFGHCGSSKYPVLETEDSLRACLAELQWPSGTIFPDDTHTLLKLVIPDNIAILKIDFYRFTDYLYFAEEGDLLELASAKEGLLLPNNYDGSWELIQGHIPRIELSWVTECIPSYRPFKEYVTYPPTL